MVGITVNINLEVEGSPHVQMSPALGAGMTPHDHLVLPQLLSISHWKAGDLCQVAPFGYQGCARGR